MKKLWGILLASTLVLSAPLARAEEGTSGKISFGPQGGYVWPNFEVNRPNVTTKNHNGYLAGVFLEFGIWALTLRPELNYVEKGYEVSNTAEITHRFLEVPVLLKFNPLNDAVVSPFIVLGPSWSNHLGSKVKLLGTTTRYDDNLNRWDVAGVAGAGIEFNLSHNFGMNLQGRYNFGFRDIDSSANEIRSRGLYAIVGLSIQD